MFSIPWELASCQKLKSGFISVKVEGCTMPCLLCPAELLSSLFQNSLQISFSMYEIPELIYKWETGGHSGTCGQASPGHLFWFCPWTE